MSDEDRKQQPQDGVEAPLGRLYGALSDDPVPEHLARLARKLDAALQRQRERDSGTTPDAERQDD